MSGSSELSNLEGIVYFVISPVDGPGYRIYIEEDMQVMGGINAIERTLENESYWFAHLGQISGESSNSGAFFPSAEFGKLREPHEDAWRLGRLNPAFGRSELEKRAFRVLFQAVERMLDSWKQPEGNIVDAYALKELKISSRRLTSLASGLLALHRVHEVLEITVMKFWYDALWPGTPSPDGLTLDEFSFAIPIQLRWATGDHLLSAEVMPVSSC